MELYQISQRIALDFSSRGVPPVVHATQYDANMRVVRVCMLATGFANFRKLYVGSEIQLKGDLRIAVDGGGYSGWTWKNIVTADGSNAMVLCHTY